MPNDLRDAVACPFCGGKAEPHRRCEPHIIELFRCTSCLAEAEAHVWNRRADAALSALPPHAPSVQVDPWLIKGIVDDCCLTNEAGEIVSFDHKDFESRFLRAIAGEGE